MADAAAREATTALLDSIASKTPDGITIPSQHLREIIEKSAGYVARNGSAFEQRMREKKSARTSFVFEDDPFHAYYAWRLAEIKAGNSTAISAGREVDAVGVSTKGREERKGPEEPEPFRFSARMPNISPKDLDVVKRTALFVARNGRNWMTTLSQREAGNYQFDFLRPTHSLYPLFSKYVDQFTELMAGEAGDGGRLRQKRLDALKDRSTKADEIIERAKKRIEWLQYQESQKVAKVEAEEQERRAYAEIDWQDFVVVETVVFDERDEEADLPAPTSLNDLQSASLEQKAKMSIDPNRRIEEAMPGFDESTYGQPQATPVQPVYPPQPFYPPQATPPTYGAYQPPFQPPHQNDDASRAAEMQAAHERARAAQQAAQANGPVKIRNDYVPRARARQQAQDIHICPNCHAQVPSNEMAEHLRIELLDPQWREQARVAQQRSLTTNLAMADVANNLKRLASQRTDVFDPVTGHAITEEEAARRKRAELNSHDGVSTTNNVGPEAPGGPNYEPPDVQEQIRQLHQKYKT